MLKVDKYKSYCNSCESIKDIVNLSVGFNNVNICGDCMIQIFDMLHTMEYDHLNQSAELKKQGRIYNDTNIKN